MEGIGCAFGGSTTVDGKRIVSGANNARVLRTDAACGGNYNVSSARQMSGRGQGRGRAMARVARGAGLMDSFNWPLSVHLYSCTKQGRSQVGGQPLIVVPNNCNGPQLLRLNCRKCCLAIAQACCLPLPPSQTSPFV